MEIKILQVFLGADGLPYKDQERTVHFPIVGSGFQGASNTTKVRFYYDELVEQDDTETSWIACAKLPNGKIGSKVLETDYDSTLGEHYALLELDSFYFQYKGDVYISLQGYQGGVQVDYDEETELYTIYGTPTIAATGSIKLSVNYATQFVGSGETSNVNFQRILADLGTKLGIRATSVFVEELPTVGNPDTFYVIHNDLGDPNKANIYIWNSVTEHYIWVGDNTLDLGNYYTKEQGEQFEEEIDNLVSSVAQGSPKGVYATLSDLQTEYPTGTDGIYVVSGTGHWYYWSGSAWTDGGVYQATQIADGSIIEKDTVFFDADVSVNRLDIDADDIETGKGVATNGTINPNANLTTSGKMRAKAGDILYLARNNGTPNQMELLANSQYPLVAYNDQDSALLVSTSGTITCPVGTAYVRTCWWTTIGVSRQWEVTLNVYPDKFYPYYDNKYTLKVKYIVDAIDDEIKNFVNCDKNIVLPSYGLYVVEGDTINIFYDNVIQYGQADRLNIYQQSKGNWNQLPRFQKSIPTLTPNYYQNYFIVSDMYPNYPKQDNDVYCNTRLTVVSANAGSGLTKKCLFIGDSMTAANVFTEKLVDLFALDVMNIQLIGTLGTTKAPSEGRGGWRAWNYAFEPNASSDGLSPTVTNPFYDSGTGEFNFSKYMTDNGYSGLDYVFICLGTNDISRSTHTSKSDILLAYNTIVDSIKTYDSNIKVVLWLLPMPCQLTNEQYKKNIFLNMKKYLIEEYDNDTARNNGIFLVDVGATLDCLNQFNYNTQNISAYDSEEIRIPTDIIHPSTNGYYEIAHTLFGMIKYLGSI